MKKLLPLFLATALFASCRPAGYAPQSTPDQTVIRSETPVRIKILAYADKTPTEPAGTAVIEADGQKFLVVCGTFNGMYVNGYSCSTAAFPTIEKEKK